jgi:hypothetical protein
MSKREAQRELYAELDARGLLEYGSVIETPVVHAVLGIEMPAYGTKSDFDKIALFELSAIDYIRNILLGQGKYLMGTDSGYRILLPSENAAQVEQYISSADKKLSRALKLSRNTPTLDMQMPDQTEARILMKRSGMQQHRPQPNQ